MVKSTTVLILIAVVIVGIIIANNFSGAATTGVGKAIKPTTLNCCGLSGGNTLTVRESCRTGEMFYAWSYNLCGSTSCSSACTGRGYNTWTLGNFQGNSYFHCICSSKATMASGAPTFCTDSDGGQVMTKVGSVTMRLANIKIYKDKCYDANSVTEYYCANDKVANIQLGCGTGYKCVNGACERDLICGNGVIDAGEVCDDGNAVTGDTCSECKCSNPDADTTGSGKDKLVKTTATTATNAVVDSCTPAGKLAEARCTKDGSGKWLVVTTESACGGMEQRVCDAGACVLP